MITLVGIVGGIGSGKSSVSEQFQRLGAEVLDGDRLGHVVLADREVIQLLRERWGERVIQRSAAGCALPTEQIDRSEVAKIVFGKTEEAETELRYLEQVTHPRIANVIASRLESLEHQASIVILDAPLLLEAGWDRLCQHLIYVDVPREIRLERLARRNWSAAELAAREARQLPLAEKRSRADWIIDNSGPLEKLAAQIQPIWQGLTLPK